MARHYDTGPYSPTNVMIVLGSENIGLRGERWSYMAWRKPWKFSKEEIQAMKYRSEMDLVSKYPGLFRDSRIPDFPASLLGSQV